VTSLESSPLASPLSTQLRVHDNKLTLSTRFKLLLFLLLSPVSRATSRIVSTFEILSQIFSAPIDQMSNQGSSNIGQ
jgi:hypothetical protein